MSVEILSGTALVLLTWISLVLACGVTGRWVPAVIDARTSSDDAWRAGLWWATGLLTVAVLLVGMAVPLRSGLAAVLVSLLVLALALLGVALRRPRRPRWCKPSRSIWTLLIAMGAGAIYLAVKALGPVTNYDTGLYHLGAVKYAGDFAIIPGLATLYFPFGYSNAQFPLAAMLGNGPWDGVGYRLLNGAILVLALSDLGSRLLNRRWRWGTFILVVGLSASLVPMIAMADAMVSSPTADTSVLILTVVSAAYLADGLERRRMAVDFSVAVVTSALLVMLRPTMAFFAMATLAVVLLAAWRRRATRATPATFWLLTAAALGLMATTTVLRDRVLSGWLLYPLSIFSFDVPWVAADPTPWRTGTLAAARDRFAPDGYVTAHSWGWIGPWTSRVLEQWEGWFLVAGAVATVIVALVSRRRFGFPRRPRLLVAAMIPSTVAVFTWFVLSPPSFRFIWGPLFCLLFIPLGAACLDLARGEAHAEPPTFGGAATVLMACAISIIAVTGYSAVARNQVDAISESRTWSFGPVAVPYAVAPIPLPPVIPTAMSSGLIVYVPSESDQCWDNYPLCTASTSGDIALRGDTLQDGFTESR